MIAKYPVETSDDEGIVDAVNYLLSGPAGLGQNFAGFSSSDPAWLSGNFRTPFTWPSFRSLYVAPIALATAEYLDARTIKFTFSAAEPTPPFFQGNQVTVAGVADPYYDGSYTRIGVVECTTTYCTVRLGADDVIQPASTGGTIELNLDDFDMSTDCNARVTVTGATDRVFISGQLDQAISYTVPSGTGELTIDVAVNRYRGFINSDPVNPDFLFDFDGNVATKTYVRSAITGTGTLDLIETVFSTLIDQPTEYNLDPATPWTAYYWYILEIVWNSTGVDPVYVTSNEFGLRSLSSQVVKQ
jgi:hypothetical protein